MTEQRLLLDLQIFKDVLLLIRKIYQHELCSKELKTYIRFECGKFFNKEIEVKEFLDGKSKKKGEPK